MSSGVSVSVEFAWRMVGQVCLDHEGGLQFPAVEDQPGLYRFDFTRTGVMHAYVGETDRLRRRLYYYRRPGPSQQTNIRLNALLRQVLGEGTVVTVSVVLGQAQMRVGDLTRACDLAAKHERVLLEHAALVWLRQNGVTALNA
jgi:hypothetical protein